MIETVLIFALVTALGELVLLAKLGVKTRLTLLGHPGAISLVAFIFNLWIHFGTVVGSMTAITAAIASHFATQLARAHWGYIVVVCGRRQYIAGRVAVDPAVLK